MTQLTRHPCGVKRTRRLICRRCCSINIFHLRTVWVRILKGTDTESTEGVLRFKL